MLKNKKGVVVGVIITLVVIIILAILYFSASFSSLPQIFIIGLYDSGKSTILYKLKLGEIVSEIPSVSFSLERVATERFSITVVDLSMHNRKNIKSLVRNMKNVAGVIFVLDSKIINNDLEAVKQELQWISTQDEVKDVKVLVLANKQDLPNVQSPEEIQNALGNWHVIGSSAFTGQGLENAFEWLGFPIVIK